MRLMQNILAAAALALIASPCWAYYEVLDTGEVLKRGQHRLTGGVQAMTEHGGTNITGMFDTGIQEDFGLRGLVGFGNTDYYFGGLVKWVPIPDVDNQPAIGADTGIVYAKWDDATEFTFKFDPMISKKLPVGEAFITPYLALPIGLRFHDSHIRGIDNTTQMTLAVAGGGQLQVPAWKNLQFMAEVGVNLDHSFSYVSAAAVFYFDNEGFRFE